MIDRLPGWLNFIVLGAFYFILFWFLRFVTRASCDLWFLIFISYFYAGGYLAKWREKQGGGWRFW